LQPSQQGAVISAILNGADTIKAIQQNTGASVGEYGEITNMLKPGKIWKSIK